MATAKLYNKSGEEKGTLELNPKMFEVPAKADLLHQAMLAIMSNRRQVLAHTKVRGEVRGGGRKPWKQKGTGRARQGSIRSPLWKGGSVIFGPRKEVNFTVKINKKMNRKAILMALSERAKDFGVSVVEDMKLAEMKTKQVASLLKKMSDLKSVLFIVPKSDLAASKPVNNLPKVSLLGADSLNVYDLLKYRHVVFLEDALAIAEKTFVKE